MPLQVSTQHAESQRNKRDQTKTQRNKLLEYIRKLRAGPCGHEYKYPNEVFTADILVKFLKQEVMVSREQFAAGIVKPGGVYTEHTINKYARAMYTLWSTDRKTFGGPLRSTAMEREVQCPSQQTIVKLMKKDVKAMKYQRERETCSRENVSGTALEMPSHTEMLKLG